MNKMYIESRLGDWYFVPQEVYKKRVWSEFKDAIYLSYGILPICTFISGASYLFFRLVGVFVFNIIWLFILYISARQNAIVDLTLYPPHHWDKDLKQMARTYPLQRSSRTETEC